MKFFSLENPVWKFIGNLADFFILSCLWYLCSLPVVTAGAALFLCRCAARLEITNCAARDKMRQSRGVCVTNSFGGGRVAGLMRAACAGASRAGAFARFKVAARSGRAVLRQRRGDRGLRAFVQSRLPRAGAQLRQQSA